jgi:hypothetical protein
METDRLPEQDELDDAAVEAKPDPQAEQINLLTKAVAMMAAREERQQDSAMSPPTPQYEQPRPGYVPQNPMDLLNPEAAKDLQDRLTMGEAKAQREMADLASRHARLQMENAAQPILWNQAQQVVKMFKMGKQQTDMDYASIAPEFDKIMASINVLPLASYPEATATNELEMRWSMAAAPILRKQRQAPVTKAEPTILAPGRGARGPQGGKPWLGDPWMVNMQQEYKMTDAQMQEVWDEGQVNNGNY